MPRSESRLIVGVVDAEFQGVVDHLDLQTLG